MKNPSVSQKKTICLYYYNHIRHDSVSVMLPIATREEIILKLQLFYVTYLELSYEYKWVLVELMICRCLSNKPHRAMRSTGTNSPRNWIILAMKPQYFEKTLDDINTMAVDVQDSYVARHQQPWYCLWMINGSSDVFYKDKFQLPVPYQCWEIVYEENSHLCCLK